MNLPKDETVATQNALEAAARHLAAECHWRGVADAAIGQTKQQAEEIARLQAENERITAMLTAEQRKKLKVDDGQVSDKKNRSGDAAAS